MILPSSIQRVVWIKLKETLTVVREKYPTGTRVELVHMDDPYTSLTTGDKGTVTFTDTHGAADFFGDNESSEIINSSDTTCGFHFISFSFFRQILMLLSAKRGDLYCRIYI